MRPGASDSCVPVRMRDRVEVMRDAFGEWRRRFGTETDVLSGLHAAKDPAAVAAAANVPVASVAGAASYFADFEDVSSQAKVCAGTACFIARGGSEPDADDAQKVYCLGYCYCGPAKLVDGRVFSGERLAPPPRAEAVSSVPVVLAGITGEAAPWRTWEATLAHGSPESVLREVALSGVRGRGGAEFPVARKWQAARSNPGPRYVVANGDEGDPGSYCDRILMEQDPHRVLEGLTLAGFAVGAQRGLVLVRSEYPAAAASMRAAVEAARADGHLRPDGFDVEIHQGAGSYVAGEETALLHTLEGRRGAVRSRPPYPTTSGFLGFPTAVNNLETLASIPWIVEYGGSSYAALGERNETGTKLVCLNERFARPGVYEVDFGSSIRWIVEELGEGLRDGRELRALQIGGPLGGFLGPDDLDRPLLARALAEVGVALGHGSFVAVDETVPPAALLRHLWRFAASESCGSCAPCKIGTRRGLQLRPASREYEQVLEVISTASLCAFGHGVASAVRSLHRVYGGVQ